MKKIISIFTCCLLSVSCVCQTMAATSINQLFPIRTNVDTFRTVQTEPEKIIMGDSAFALGGKTGWTIYTPDSDFTGVETTLGFMFEHSDGELVGAVKTKDTEVLINYFPTSNTQSLSENEKVSKCLERFANNFFEYPVGIYPFDCGYEIYQHGVERLMGGDLYSSYLFVFLQNGIIEVVNIGYDESVSDIVYEILDNIYVSDKNDFVYNDIE